MVVETNLHMGKGIVIGDAFSLRRVVKGIPTGVTLSNAYLYIVTGTPISKSITSANVAGTGQIEDTGADGIGRIRFDLSATDTGQFTAETDYDFDISVTLSSGDKLTLERGKTQALAQRSTS